ncbi:hypothetical protein WA026_007726 [Henosepilachna vigintioctopunctata]|uniref:Uncharacterized protein n=1 Tax=Henosepilachna vigintioctopunctata TaxID=420089 RepID=A0AAW1U3U8_9CUCU
MMPDQIEYSKNNGCHRRTKLEKILICSFPIFIILTLLCLVGIAMRKSCKQEEVAEECRTSHCVKAAAELLEYIDLNKDPCTDFYKFVCGTYRKNAVKTDSTSPWASTGVLFRNELKSLVVDPISRKDTSAHVALKKFYRECMNETKIDFNENAAFMKAIDSLGGWPLIRTSWNASNFKWDDWYIQAKQLGLPLIGFFTFQKKQTETNGPLLAISGPRLSSMHSQYHFLKLMKKLTAVFDVTYSEQDNIEVHNFITKLEEYKNVMDFDDTDEDSSVISNIQNLTTICPNVTWLKILNGLSGSYKFSNSSMISFNIDKMEKYCSMLEKLLQNTTSKVIANYYVWTIIENAHLFMDKYIRRAYEDVTYDKPDRFEFCYNIAKSRFKHVVEAVYIRRKINRHVKPQILEMIEILKELYAEHLQNSSWMDEETKSTAIKKAKAIDHLIGSIDEVYDVEKFDKILGVDKFKFTSDIMFQMLQQKLTRELHHFFETLYVPSDDWDTLFRNTMKVNAYFVMPLNLMIIPAPILTSIFYNRKFPAFMNYGAIGRTISHEFMHGFSKSSRLVIGSRGKFVNWWTDETTDNYDKT